MTKKTEIIINNKSSSSKTLLSILILKVLFKNKLSKKQLKYGKYLDW